MVLIDDYGHHPTEIKATLSAAQEYVKLGGYKKSQLSLNLTATRVWLQFKGIAKAFEGVDELVILPVYAAGEEPIELDLKAVFPKALFVEDIKREGNFSSFQGTGF